LEGQSQGGAPSRTHLGSKLGIVRLKPSVGACGFDGDVVCEMACRAPGS